MAVEKMYRLRESLSRQEVADRLNLELRKNALLFSKDNGDFAGMFCNDNEVRLRQEKAQEKITEFADKVP